MLAVVAAAVFLLTTVGVFLLLHRSLLRVVFGIGCLSHAVNLLVLSAGRWGERAPLVVKGVGANDVSDPLPQAFVLTAIVISMAFTLYLLTGMAVHTRRGGVPELVAPPESDADPASEAVRAELTGRGGEA